ncbi:hypothetical protein [Brucella intermedia]|uniref:hypothetical protein n=1 Tax=Brucella intermedia TaxID=94625 RepID=UPI00235F480D|nr:hypothetical protein [Brucella intermedia]
MARTKAAKLQAKRSRGRPKKDVPLREPNGRASRMKEDPAKVAMEARMRHYGVPADMARDPRTGSYLGRLAMAGRGEGISQDQYEAATRYIDLYNSYQKAIGSPGAHYEQIGGVNASDPDAYADWCIRVKHAYKSAQAAIHEAQAEERSENLWAGLQYVVIQDQEFPHLLSSTRLVCNALHRHFMLDNKRKSPNK